MGSPEKSKKIQKQKKHKKQKKDKKQKKQKKHKRQKQYKSPSPPSHYAPKIQQVHRQVAVTSNHPQQSNFQQEMPQQRMIIPCRRCKQRTFSLKTRTCSACGYPKQQRPQYFPKTKQVQVLDLVRQGKLVHNSYAPVLIQVIANDRFGKKQRVKCCPTDTIFDFKKLISAQTGTRPEKIRLQKANIIYKDHLTLEDYEIKDGTGLQMYYD